MIGHILRLAPFALLVIIAGASDGLNQTLLFHFTDFMERFPSADQNYWNPYLSWTNKGSNLFLRTVFVFTTDAYHLTRSIHWVLLLVGSVGLTRIRFIWPYAFGWFYVLCFALVYCLKGVGFHFVYTFLF